MKGRHGQHVFPGAADQGLELDSASDGPAYPVERRSGGHLALPIPPAQPIKEAKRSMCDEDWGTSMS